MAEEVSVDEKRGREEKALYESVQAAFKNKSPGVNTTRMGNGKDLSLDRVPVPPNAPVTFYGKSSSDVTIDCGVLEGRNVTIRIMDGTTKVVRRSIIKDVHSRVSAQFAAQW
ncbi:hypothetical protein GW746_01185 [Candidatus Saccharibacteria bacterium]|nr:hypothetical protein [Candidatus Saccharibacteria bacterium]NCS83013.1 hypothetical protein [Candidatus Saccharibacteria bacterium]